MIGAYSKMQTTYWEDEMKLIDGVPYMIDFFQDFSSLQKNGEPALIVHGRVIVQPVEKTVETYSALEERRRTSELFKQADKIVKKEQKQEEKWKRKQKRDGRSEKERLRDAEHFLDHIDEWIHSK